MYNCILLTIVIPKKLIAGVAKAATSMTTKNTPSNKKVTFSLMTANANYSIPVTNSTALWHHKKFNRNQNTVFLATGWITSVNTSNGALDAISHAYMCRNDVNFIAIDTLHYMDNSNYIMSAENTKAIGNYVGIGLKQLIDTSYPIERIHLIGI